jgi:hypothetical protein
MPLLAFAIFPKGQIFIKVLNVAEMATRKSADNSNFPRR